MNASSGDYIATTDTPDVALMLSNINDNINLFMFLFSCLLGVAFVIFICYVMYKFILDCFNV